MFPRRLARLSDPMSGFFAVRLAALNLDTLDPIGFKILLEIAVRQPRLQDRRGAVRLRHPARRREQGLGARRASGSSGTCCGCGCWCCASRCGSPPPPRGLARLRRLVAFGAVGASGMVVNTAALWLFVRAAVTAPLPARGGAGDRGVSTTWNFVFTELLVFRGPKPGTLAGPRRALLRAEPSGAAAAAAAAGAAGRGVRANVLVANVITLVLLFLVRFVIADSAIYAHRSRSCPSVREAADAAILSICTGSAALPPWPGSRGGVLAQAVPEPLDRAAAPVTCHQPLPARTATRSTAWSRSARRCR